MAKATSKTASVRREQLSDNVVLYCGDSAEVMATEKIKCDAVVTDPPYGIDENDKKIASRGKLAEARDYGVVDWDKKPIDKAAIDRMLKSSRYQIIFGGNYFEGLGPTPCWFVWDKQNTGDFADAELAWTNLPGAVRLVRWTWNGMIRQGDDVREHPTQKPLGVMQWCINKLPDGCKTILDPYMGSGTTGVAAVSLGRGFVGIEREPHYFEVSLRRITKELSQDKLF